LFKQTADHESVAYVKTWKENKNSLTSLNNIFIELHVDLINIVNSE